MTGTFLNTGAILLGGTLGVLLGNRLPERLKQTLIAGLGLFTLAYGLLIFMRSNNELVVLGSLLIGGLLGEWWQIEDGMRRLGMWLARRLTGAETKGGEKNFARGFLSASLLYCVGPVAILGSIQDGLGGDYSILAVKSVLDGIASLAFASSLGVGVLFSAPIVLMYQGAITLLAAQAQILITTEMMTEMTATGGLILIGIAISSLLEIKPIRASNFLPALMVAPLLVAVFVYLGLY